MRHAILRVLKRYEREGVNGKECQIYRANVNLPEQTYLFNSIYHIYAPFILLNHCINKMLLVSINHGKYEVRRSNIRKAEILIARSIAIDYKWMILAYISGSEELYSHTKESNFYTLWFYKAPNSAFIHCLELECYGCVQSN